MADRILVTGSSGTVGGFVAAMLRERDVPVAAATRRPTGTGDVTLDWSDPSTFPAALEGISAAFLVAPTDRTDHLAAMRPLLEEAVRCGIGPLVLLSAASLPEGGPMMGEVQAWLRTHAPRWMSLRPSWFMQNLTGQHLKSILDDGAIYSATGDGRIAFIDAADIARVAVAALTDPGFPNGEVVLTGPEPLGYDRVAAAVAEVAGRPVQHRRLSVDELAGRHQAAGLPRDYATLLAGMDAAIARGTEDRVTDAVRLRTGRPPGTLDQFLAREAPRFVQNHGAPSSTRSPSSALIDARSYKEDHTE